jgi:hypothetical protein
MGSPSAGHHLVFAIQTDQKRRPKTAMSPLDQLEDNLLRYRFLSAAAAGAAIAAGPWIGVPAQAAGATADSDYSFVAKIEVGQPGSADGRGCSGALIRPDWVITSAACFAQNGVPITDGAPALRTTVTVGRPDLSTSTGHVLTAVRVVSRSDRDVALVQLDRAATGVTPVELGTGPTAGEVLHIAGYGRTGTEWVPRRQHAGDFTVESAPGTTSVQLANTPNATVCQGDAGGPALRDSAGGQVLVAVASSSGQAGCYKAAAGASAGAVGTRVDDLAAWIRARIEVLPPIRGDVETGSGRWADFDGDGKADYLVIEDSGVVNVYLNRGGSRGSWELRSKVALGLTSDRSKVRFADFDGDGKTDYLHIEDSGAINAYLNRGGDGAGAWEVRGKVALGVTSDRNKVRFADFDGDGKDDYLIVEDNGTINAYLNRGGDGGGGWQLRSKVALGVTTDRNKVRFADFDGDRKDDYLIVEDNGTINAYLNRGGDGGGGWQLRSKFALGLTSDRNKVRFADFDGDRKDDYALINSTDGYPVVYLNRGGDGGGGWEVLPT